MDMNDNKENLKILEVYDISEVPLIDDCRKKYYICIGGNKNYQCILSDKNLSRGEFMEQYASMLDEALNPVYEDNDIVIRQDAKIALPGFYIVATKRRYDRITDMPLETYIKCMNYTKKISKCIRKEMKSDDKIYIYYDEHYKKPMSTHFWVMPIYKKYLDKYDIEATILKKDIWYYQDIFKFIFTKDDIYKYNNLIREQLTHSNR